MRQLDIRVIVQLSSNAPAEYPGYRNTSAFRNLIEAFDKLISNVWRVYMISTSKIIPRSLTRSSVISGSHTLIRLHNKLAASANLKMKAFLQIFAS